jgi:hypothetical protein
MLKHVFTHSFTFLTWIYKLSFNRSIDRNMSTAERIRALLETV